MPHLKIESCHHLTANAGKFDIPKGVLPPMPSYEERMRVFQAMQGDATDDSGDIDVDFIKASRTTKELTLTPAKPENLHLVSAEERKRVFEQMADIEFHESSADLIRTIHESKSSSEPVPID